MNTLRTIIGGLYEKVIVLIGVLIVLLPISPLNIIQPARDSGVFLYIGWRMLQGEIPYRQLWDHKPPMIFFIDALGLFIGGGSIWGVWLLELILLFFAALLGFTLIKRFLGSLPALFSLSLWLMSLVFIINGGNLTTEYTLVLQFASLWLAVEAEEKGYFFWRGYLIGVLTALAFFTKQNVIGIGLAIVIYIIISRLLTRQFKRLLRALVVILLGSLTVTVVLLLFFVLTGALEDFWDAAFAYNFVYINNPAPLRFGGRLRGIRLLARTGLAQFALAGWAAGLTLLLCKKKIGPKYTAPLAIALLALPLEFILVGISGRGYEHYFMALLPIFSIFAAFAFWLILSRIPALADGKMAGLFFTTALIILLLFAPADEYYQEAKNYRDESEAMITERIRAMTAENDSVLLWGNEAAYNFSAGRVSPSRFIYQVPLYLEGYTDQDKIEEFLADIVENNPKLLIDSANPRTPLYRFGITSPKIEESGEPITLHLSGSALPRGLHRPAKNRRIPYRSY